MEQPEASTARNRWGASRRQLEPIGATLGGVGVVVAVIALLAVVGMQGQAAGATGARTLASTQDAPSSSQQKQPQSAAGNTQPPPASGKLESKVKVVTVYATARDKKGKIVANLGKDDFMIDQDGSPQTISFFSRESDVPLTLGPLVDTSFSTRHVLGAERDASYAFLNDILRPDKDKAFLIHFDQDVELLQDLTSSREKLKAAIALLTTPGREDESQGGGRGFRAGTLLYDSIYLASDEIMRKQQGRKALIILSDGVDHGSKKYLEDAVESAQRADTAVYSILFADDEEHDRGGGFGHGGGGIGHGPFGYPGGGGGPGGQGGPGGGQRRNPQHEEGASGKKVLQRISSETGGSFFEVSKKLSIDQIYAQIEEELRNQYSIGYTPSPADSSGEYHKIHVSLKNKDLTVVAREGYYSTPYNSAP